jgi:hypothetical protein
MRRNILRIRPEPTKGVGKEHTHMLFCALLSFFEKDFVVTRGRRMRDVLGENLFPILVKWT